MIKVLIVSPIYPYPEYKDGASKIIANLLKEDKVFDAKLVCIDYIDSDYENNNRIDFLKYKKPSKISILSNWLLTTNPMTTCRYIGNFDLIVDYINQNSSNYDVIHLATTFLLPVLNRLSSDIKKKIVLFPIDSLVLFNKRRYKTTQFSLKKILYYLEYLKVRQYERKYYNQISRTCFVSNVDAKQNDELLKYNRSHFIPNGVDVEYFTRDHQITKEKSLIFTGNLDYSPNKDAIDILVNVIFPKILDHFPDMVLYLVGIASDEIISTYSSDNVIVTGFVDDIRTYIDKASIYLSPLRFGSGIKNKVLEAMSMEIPIIGTSVSFEGIEVDDNSVSIIKNPNNCDDWLEAIINLIQNKEIQEKKTQNARVIIEKAYSWSGIRKQYGDFYENCISNR